MRCHGPIRGPIAASALGIVLTASSVIVMPVAVWPAGWPVDPVIALGIAAWSAWEGRQAWRGDGCC
jgi:hypothetical protein